MKICFITPNNHFGLLPRTFDNLRTEFAWQIALQATHYPIQHILDLQAYGYGPDTYDVGIIILPKKLETIDTNALLLRAKRVCKKLAVMQEGPAWYFQDYDCANQINYLNFLGEMDFLLVHNAADIPYFRGIFKKPTFHLPSLMLTDGIESVKREDMGNVIIGGNFCSWYGGIDSYFVAQAFKQPIYAPSMGRKIANEDQFPNLTHLPFLWWKDWMHQLSKFHVGVHLMRTHAAGTFALNCAYWGIPCIGYKGLDTQETLHPLLTVNIGDIEKANDLAIKLRDDKHFYNFASECAVDNYTVYYKESVWLRHWETIYGQIKN